MKLTGAKRKQRVRTRPAKKKASVRSKTASKTVASKSKVGKKRPVAKSKAAKKKPVVRTSTARTISKKPKTAPKKAALKTRKLVRKRRGPAKAVENPVPNKSSLLQMSAFPAPRLGRPPGSQSGDLQGLSSVEGANSESVEELLEEGNAFEAGVVMGVEGADDADLEEVRTREVLEDDVPGEYLETD